METIVGVFDDSTAAARTVSALESAGFGADRVQMKAQQAAASATDPDLLPDDGMLAEIGHFLSSLFGTDDSAQAGVYTEALNRGHCVVTVDTTTDRESNQVINVMENNGVIDIDERASTWIAGGWTPAGGMSPVATVGSEVLTASALVPGQPDAPAEPMKNPMTEDTQPGRRTVQRGAIRVVRRDEATSDWKTGPASPQGGL